MVGKSTAAKHCARASGLWVTFATAIAAILLMVPLASAASSDPFSSLGGGLTQQLFGTGASSDLFGGVAFAPNGDVWTDDCLFSGSSLHRFSATDTYSVSGSVVHSETTVSSSAGCGLTNGLDGRLYSNTGDGVAFIDGSTGAALSDRLDRQGTRLVSRWIPRTITSCTWDRIAASALTCTIYSLDTQSLSATTFATIPAQTASFIDGIAFDPTGSDLFLSVRSPSTDLLVLNRSGQVVQEVPAPSEPDGIAFHVTPGYVVTNNTDGTMTEFDFPSGDFSQSPTVNQLASGGLRGDLAQVGPDSCLYVTQDGTRFADGTNSSDNSLVRLCPGFAPPPGVAPSNRYVALGDSVPYGHGLLQIPIPRRRSTSQAQRATARRIAHTRDWWANLTST